MKTDIIQEIISNLESPMTIRPFNVYVVPWIKDTLQNLVDTNIYLFWYDLDYVVNEEEIMRAEWLWVWEPKITTDWIKIVNIQYIWKIISRWHIVSAQNKETWEIEIIKSKVSWNKSLDFEKNLKKAIKNQLINFHSDVKERWSENWRWWFFEIKEHNPIKLKAFYLQKTNHTMYFDFDDSWKLLNSYSWKHNYFKLTPDIVYDLKRRLFMKDWKDVLFYEYNSDLKRLFIEKLIANDWYSVTKEELTNELWLKWLDANKKLLEIKRSLIERDFVWNLWIDENYLQEDIFICPKNQGYRLVGTFTNEI